MASPPVSELTERARAIFRLVVEGYLADGMPVGSKTLATEGGINLSPASIRSVLSELEALGLLAAPQAARMIFSMLVPPGAPMGSPQVMA